MSDNLFYHRSNCFDVRRTFTSLNNDEKLLELALKYGCRNSISYDVSDTSFIVSGICSLPNSYIIMINDNGVVTNQVNIDVGEYSIELPLVKGVFEVMMMNDGVKIVGLNNIETTPLSITLHVINNKLSVMFNDLLNDDCYLTIFRVEDNNSVTYIDASEHYVYNRTKKMLIDITKYTKGRYQVKLSTKSWFSGTTYFYTGNFNIV